MKSKKSHKSLQADERSTFGHCVKCKVHGTWFEKRFLKITELHIF